MSTEKRDLRERLGEAFDKRSWEDVTGHEVLRVHDAAEVALDVFAEWLRARSVAAGMQYRAEAELRRLADEIAPRSDATEAQP